MTHARTTFTRLACLVALSSCMGLAAAQTAAPVQNNADYSDIIQLIRAGKTAEALTKADQRLASSPRDPQLRFLRGVAQADSGKHADAIATFTKLTEDYPELPEPYNNLAVLYAHQNQLDKARTALEMAIRTNPSYATAHENLGDIYAKLAGQAYNKALQLDPSNAPVKPKLELLREVFTPSTGKGAKPTAIAAAPARPAAPTAAPASPGSPAPAIAAAPAPAAKPATAAPAAAVPDKSAEADINAAIQKWAQAWSDQNMTAYIAAYDSNFRGSNPSHAAWQQERRARIVGRSKLDVGVSNVRITVNGDKATARFRQSYSSDALKSNSNKTLGFALVNGRWLIVSESGR